ncbi:alpha/beta hydrolase [Novosphingobium sp.]|uniref:alpha/beta hydrolase n=1 Tax=Novosphingobium sp. TaxID=1874826 RepID=UPI0038B9E5DD
MTIPRTRAAIAGMGTTLGPAVIELCRALFEDEQHALADRVAPVAVDCVYGAHPRNRLDLYGQGPGAPVLLFVHGGGFRVGDKGGADWQNAAVGRMAAEAGLLGAVMNYRLVPDAGWPSGGEDVLAAFDWLVENAAQHGGDPARIVLVGTSAGAVHIAGALKLRPDLAAAGLVLLSGLYGYTPHDERDVAYYGEQALYAERMPRAALVETALPLLVACAEFDPPRFQAEFLGLMQARLERHGAMPRGYMASGHNHYSMAMHLGTSDRRLAEEIIGFVDACGG